jgi:hypothetical protein
MGKEMSLTRHAETRTSDAMRATAQHDDLSFEAAAVGGLRRIKISALQL